MKLIVNKYQGTNDQNDSLWYVGKIAQIIKDDKTYTIKAVGDVVCDLIAKHDIKINDVDYKKGNVILNIIDKKNSGEFKKKIETFIKNDNELNDLILNENPDYELVFGNNNWLEVFYDNGKSDILDCVTIDEAINNILENIKDKIKLENNNIIYCRSANFSEHSVESQEEICKHYIFENSGNHLYDLFVDNGFNGLDPFKNPAFSSMINLSEKGKIFYSKDITRLARDFIESSKIYDIILNNNADFYLVDAHESLLKIGKVDNQVISSCIELEKEEDDLEHE